MREEVKMGKLGAKAVCNTVVQVVWDIRCGSWSSVAMRHIVEGNIEVLDENR